MFARTAGLRLLGTLTVLMLVTMIAHAQAVQVPSVSLQVGSGNQPQQLSTTLQILALLTVLSIAPSILILTTCFTRFIIIFSFLRTAMGTPTIPPNQVLVGLCLFLTFFVMGPTYQQIHKEALVPFQAGQLSLEQAIDRAEDPMRKFMLKSTYERDLELFLSLRGESPATPEDVSLITLIPAFIISELKTAFIIGFYIFVPFLIIDLVVASALMSMGMMMLPPIVVALPAKLLVFVLADGWGMLVSALLAGYT
jgi:flagellar biosynthetic protein FliP